MEVKTFDEKKLKTLMKECDPYLLKYIKAQENNSANWKDIAQSAIKKLRESAPNIEYKQCPICNSKLVFKRLDSNEYYCSFCENEW